MKKLFLDIETLPADGKDLPIVKQLFEEQKKKNGKKTPDVSFDGYFRGTSFSGEFGRIFCIGYAVDDQPTQCLSGDEKEMLEKFWQIASDASVFIGHNIMDFDMRFIYKRSIIIGVQPTQNLSFARYRSNPIFDTMREWEKWGSTGVSLHKLALALGLESSKQDGIDGSQVYDFFLVGKLAEICDYCKRDVEVTRKIYNRITFTN
ncbi:MAG: ribonuclease H-like domain-containing protein [Candidatus Berkelbacteria bacterium]|nr:ribonuclease H-like domain-containing protein [Candidatus Berkelbacteria bacterium]